MASVSCHRSRPDGGHEASKPLISRAQRSVMRVAIPLARYLHLPREQPRALKSRHYGRRVKQPPGAPPLPAGGHAWRRGGDGGHGKVRPDLVLCYRHVMPILLMRCACPSGPLFVFNESIKCQPHVRQTCPRSKPSERGNQLSLLFCTRFIWHSREDMCWSLLFP